MSRDREWTADESAEAAARALGRIADTLDTRTTSLAEEVAALKALTTNLAYAVALLNERLRDVPLPEAVPA